MWKRNWFGAKLLDVDFFLLDSFTGFLNDAPLEVAADDAWITPLEVALGAFGTTPLEVALGTTFDTPVVVFFGVLDRALFKALFNNFVIFGIDNAVGFCDAECKGVAQRTLFVGARFSR